VKCIHHGLVTKRGAVLAALLLGVVAGVQAEQQFENFGYQGQGFFVTGDYASSRQDANGGGLPSANGSGVLEFLPMELLINGESRQFSSPLTVAELVLTLNHAGKRIAVERNGEIVPRGRHGETMLADGDRIEIVVAVGGG
jgi:sulfur carrier protein